MPNTLRCSVCGMSPSQCPLLGGGAGNFPRRATVDAPPLRT